VPLFPRNLIPLSEFSPRSRRVIWLPFLPLLPPTPHTSTSSCSHSKRGQTTNVKFQGIFFLLPKLFCSFVGWEKSRRSFSHPPPHSQGKSVEVFLVDVSENHLMKHILLKQRLRARERDTQRKRRRFSGFPTLQRKKLLCFSREGKLPPTST
jgi:hypothetical protein